MDPLAKKFAWVTPFNYAENEPVGHIDLWGLQKYKPDAPAPSGITPIGSSTVPQGAIVDRDKGISAGAFTLHGVSSPNGDYWQATRHNSDGTWEDSYVVGVESVGEFIRNSGKYDYLDKTRTSALELGGNAEGDLVKGFKDSWTPMNVLMGVSIGGKILLPGGIGSLGRFVEAEIQAEAETSTRYISVFHKGNLNNGKVTPGRSSSTGLDRASVKALGRSGKVYQFDIPEGVYNDWINSGKARTLRDFDITTGVYNNEVRFHGSISGELNKFIKE